MSMIQISNLTFAYEGGYDNIFENLSLQIDTSWKLGLVGRNGRGKTTLLKLLMGQYSYQGQISADTQFDYFPFTIEDPRQSPWRRPWAFVLIVLIGFFCGSFPS